MLGKRFTLLDREKPRPKADELLEGKSRLMIDDGMVHRLALREGKEKQTCELGLQRGTQRSGDPMFVYFREELSLKSLLLSRIFDNSACYHGSRLPSDVRRTKDWGRPRCLHPQPVLQ